MGVFFKAKFLYFFLKNGAYKVLFQKGARDMFFFFYIFVFFTQNSRDARYFSVRISFSLSPCLTVRQNGFSVISGQLLFVVVRLFPFRMAGLKIFWIFFTFFFFLPLSLSVLFFPFLLLFLRCYIENKTQKKDRRNIFIVFQSIRDVFLFPSLFCLCLVFWFVVVVLLTLSFPSIFLPFTSF